MEFFLLHLLKFFLSELNKNYIVFTSSLTKLDTNYKNTLSTQKKLKYLHRHSSCVVTNLQEQIKEKNTQIVRLKAAQIKDPVFGTNKKSEPKLGAEISEDNTRLVDILKEQLEHKTVEVEGTIKLLETTKLTLREMSEVFLKEREDWEKRVGQLEDEGQRVQVGC